MSDASDTWKTKPTDRFVLKWIKCHLSARITPRLLGITWLQPWMITVGSACLGVVGGVFFGLGWAFIGGLVGISAQILDGVDGQFARFTKKESIAGAFLDSVLDRYPDGAMIIGLTIYIWNGSGESPSWIILALGFLAIAGSNLISYTTARAETLGIDLGAPTLASKGTRMTVMSLSGLGSVIWAQLPMVALGYVAVHSNAVVIKRIITAYRFCSQAVKKNFRRI